MKRFLFVCVIILITILNFSSPPSTKSYKVWNSFLDEKTNSEFFALKNNIFIFNIDKVNWFKFADKIVYVYTHSGLNYPSIIIRGSRPNFYFDINKKVIYEGNNYYISPDTNWGYVQGMQGIFVKSLLLKNMETNELEEILESNASISVEWTRDNKLLIGRYSDKEKQKEIVIYNPKDKTFKQLTIGSLKLFFPDRNIILFTKNEAQRKPWILSIKDGKERRVTDYEAENLYKQVRNSNFNEPKLPTNFDIESAIIIDPPIVTKFEHNLQVENKDIPVTFIFKELNKTYYPIRPLMQGLNLKVECMDSNQNNYKYKVVYGEKSIELTNQNSIIYEWRLFVTKNELDALGINNLKITPIL